MRCWPMALLLLAPAFAAESLSPAATPEPPKCEKETRSRFWPQEANDNPRAAMRLAREGKLLICTRGAWRYHWRAVTVSVHATGAPAKAKSSR